MATGGSIANRIKDLRLESGLNQKKFSEEVGEFSSDHLAKMERGDVKEPKFEHLIAIARFCGKSTDYILTGHNFIPSGIAQNQNMTLESKNAKDAIASLNKCARSIKKLDTEVVQGIEYYERELQKIKATPEIEKALEAVRQEGCVTH